MLAKLVKVHQQLSGAVRPCIRLEHHLLQALQHLLVEALREWLPISCNAPRQSV
jgi:hypothetical protein